MTPPPDDPVQEWLDLHRSGQNPSLDELCRLCQEQVRCLVRPRLRRFPDVEREERTTDITNEALVRLLAALRDVCPPTTLELNRFLARIIRRVLLDRAKAIRRRALPLAAPGSEVAWAADHTDHPIDHDLMAAFHEYVEALPPEEKILFDLLYYRGLTTAAVAALLGCPPTTLKRRWVEARLRLIDRFGDDPTNS
jgi:RNA polymerase sigma factor (sigma-70 family)